MKDQKIKAFVDWYCQRLAFTLHSHHKTLELLLDRESLIALHKHLVIKVRTHYKQKKITSCFSIKQELKMSLERFKNICFLDEFSQK